MFRATGSILSTMWIASAAAVTGTMLTKSCNSTLHSPLPCLLNHFWVKPTNVLQKVEKSRSWASCGSSSISVAHLFCTPWPSTSGSPRRRLLVRAARIESKAVPLASRAPDFELPEPLTGKVWKLGDFEGYPALLVMFICNHCPFVKHLKKDIVKLANEYMQKGLAVIAISSNSVITHPEDGPDLMAEEAKQFEFPFPYLYDQTQEVARAFGAACTPDFFLFKKDGRRPFELVYHGQFDDSRPNSNKPITGRDLRLALDCVLSGRPLSSTQQPSVGCSIKWHPRSTP